MEILAHKYLLYPIIILSTALGCFLLIRFTRYAMNRSLRIASEKLKVDPTQYTFLKNAVSVVIVGLGIVVVFQLIPELRQFGLPIFASAGVLAAVIGFASQQALSNIVGGIFIVMFKPFRVGDIVRIGAQHAGTVEDITLRHTVIRNFENKRLVIPNSIMNAEVIENANITDERICIYLEIGIGYESDMDKALSILQHEAESHPSCIDKRTPEEISDGVPKVIVRVVNLMDSAIILRAYVWGSTPSEAFAMRCDLLKTMVTKFKANGIEIPFPQRVVRMRG